MYSRVTLLDVDTIRTDVDDVLEQLAYLEPPKVPVEA